MGGVGVREREREAWLLDKFGDGESGSKEKSSEAQYQGA
jgi:hypothetical protein